MAIRGLGFITWLGWLTGTILVNRPWGNPSFPSWFSFCTPYSLILFLLQSFVVVDGLYNNSEGLQLDDTKSRFGKWVTALSLGQFVVLTVLLRLILFVKAKKLGKLMETLGEEDEAGYESVNRRGKWPSFETCVIYTSLVGSLALGISTGVDYLTHNADKPTWINSLGLGVAGYGLFSVLFLYIPMISVHNCALAIVTVFSIRVSEILCKFCDQVKDDLPSIVNDDERGDLEIYNVLHIRSEKGNYGRDADRDKFTREGVIHRFEELKDILKLADEALSTIIFVVTVVMTLNLVGSASQLVVNNHRGTALAMDVCRLAVVGVQMMLLQIGQKVDDMQLKAKTRLTTEFVNLSWSSEKIEMEEVIQNIVDWNWKMSGSGFFTVDRRLASGIFSLVLNYVVIFVQLNIAIEDPPTVCTKPSSTSSNPPPQ